MAQMPNYPVSLLRYVNTLQTGPAHNSPIFLKFTSSLIQHVAVKAFNEQITKRPLKAEHPNSATLRMHTELALFINQLQATVSNTIIQSKHLLKAA